MVRAGWASGLTSRGRGLIVEEYWSEGRPGRKRGEARVTRTYAYRDGELRPEDTSTPFKLR
jgi:hypothetical protein